MRRIGEAILKKSVWIPLVFTILALSVASAAFLPKLEMREDETAWLSASDPTLLNYHWFEDVFGRQDEIIVAFESPDPFEESEIIYLTGLTHELEQLPYIDDATSLTIVDDVTSLVAGLNSRPLIDERDSPKTEAERTRLDARINDNPFVEGTLISGDRKTVSVILSTSEAGLDSRANREVTSAITQFLAQEQERTGRKFYFGGGPIVDGYINEVIESDIVLFTPMALLITGLLLLVIFRSWVYVLFPLITVCLGLLWTFGVKAATGSPITPVSSALIALIIVIGVAGSIHIGAYYRLELARVRHKREAMLNTYARAGTPSLFTALTTAVGFGSLALSPIPAISHLGALASFGIMSSFFISIVLVPLGLQLSSGPFNEHEKVKRWESLGRFATGSSKWLVGLGLLITIGMGLGILSIEVEGSLLQYIKADSIIRQSADFIDNRLSGSSSMEVVIIGAPNSFKETEVLREIDHFQKVVGNYQGVSGSTSMVDYAKLISKAASRNALQQGGIPSSKQEVDSLFRFFRHSDDLDIDEFYVESPQGDIARISIRTRQMDAEQRTNLREGITEFTSENLRQFRLLITGTDELVWQSNYNIVNTQIYSLGLALLVIFGLMGLLFGLRGMLASILPNTLPIAFVFGLMGYAGFRLNVATITIASITIGLVIDDTIHYFSHFRANYVATYNRPRAAIKALEDVGSALLFTTITLAFGFIIFILSESAFLVTFGILSFIAIIVAFAADILLGPSLLSQFKVFEGIHKSPS